MPTNEYDAVIQQAASANGLDPAKFRAQLVQESGLNPAARSKAGALGIGQIIPKYWQGQHGLETLEDFSDPVKSINAAAAIMGAKVRQHGSWNAALVAYNAGEGKKNKNINAYNEGRLDLLPTETQDYLKKLGDVDGIPEASAMTLAQPGVLFQGNVPVGAPLGQRRAQLDTSGGDPFNTATQGLVDSFTSGLRASTMGTINRAETSTFGLTSPTDYPFDDQDLELIRSSDLGAAGVRFVMRNAANKEAIPELIQLAKENRAASTANRTLVGSLSYGVGEMVGDPVTYVTLALPGGIYGRTAQLFSGTAARVAAGAGAVAAEGAITNLASESIRESTTGTDADYGTAIAAGAVFSVGLLGAGALARNASDRISRGLNRAEASQTAEGLRKGGAEGVVDPTVVRPADLDELAPGWRRIGSEGVPEGFTRSPVAEAASEAVNAHNVLIQMPNGDVIHPASGAQFSATNPFNPINNVPVEPNLGGRFSFEIGDVVAGSRSEEFRSMAWDLIRTTRGYADGSSGKTGVTAQDVDKVMRGQHATFQLDWDSLRTEAFSDPVYQGHGWTLAEKRRVFNEKVMRAVESDDFSGLLPSERRAAELRKQRYTELYEAQMDPGASWGVPTRPLMTRGAWRANYQPVVYNEVRLGALRETLGDEALQDAVARSFYGSYLKDPEVRARTDAYLESIGADFDAQEYARRTAFGIVNQGDGLNVGRLNLMMEQRGFSPESTPDFRKHRSTFGYDHDVPLPGGGRFSVNDLRSWDADLIDSAYFNRVKGDVSVSVGTGRTPDEFREWLAGAQAAAGLDANLKGDVLAFEKIAGSLYGVGIRAGGERVAAVQGMFQDLAFMKSSAFMGLLNYGEIAAGLAQHGLGFALRAIPGLGQFFQNVKYGKASAETLRTAQNVVWGSALDRAILPTYRDAVDHATRKLWADSGNNAVNNVIGTLSGTVKATAERFWTSRMLNATNQQIIEAARADFFADLAAHALGSRKSTFAGNKKLKMASITEEQFEGMKQLLRDTMRVEADGTLTIHDQGRLQSDPRIAHLRRYGNYWSEQVIQQNAIGSTFKWSHLPVVGMVTQFMSFVTRSVNAKLIRGHSDIMRNGDADSLLSLYVIGGALGTLQVAGVSYLQSLKFTNEKDRRTFLRERIGDDGDYAPLIATSLKRMPVMAGPSWLYDTVGSTGLGQQIAPDVFQFAGYGKTSTEAKLKQDKLTQAGPLGGFLGDAVENAPAIKMVDSVLGASSGALQRTMADTFDERESAIKLVTRGLNGLVPNDPVSQRAYQEILEFSGVK